MAERLDVPWVRLATVFPEHPKVVGLTDAAFRLEISAICYSGRHLTDGHIPTGWVPRRLARAVPQLEARHLWVPSPEGDGWILHDFLDWQTSRAEVEDARRRMSEGGKRGAQIRWGTRKGPPWATP